MKLLISALVAITSFLLLTPAIGYEAAAGFAGLGFVASNSVMHKVSGGALLSSLGAAPGMGARGNVGIVVNEPDRAALEYLYAHPTYSKYANKIKQTTLVAEAVVNNSDSTLVFKFIDQNSSLPVEVPMRNNDAMFVNAVALGLVDYDRAGAKTNAVPEFHPNVTAFGATAAGFLHSIYQTGKFHVTVGTEEKLAIHCSNFLNVPETQKSASTNFSKYNPEEVFFRINPSFIIDGFGSNLLEVKYKTFSGWAGGTSATAGNVIAARLYLKGFLIVGGSANI